MMLKLVVGCGCVALLVFYVFRKRTKLIGLTGGIGCGKSTVSAILSRHARIIDADLIAREVVEIGRPAWRKIKHHFGEGVLHADGTLNREALGLLVFNDPNKRRLLDSLIHPEIFKVMAWQYLRHCLNGERLVILEAPLLFETKILPKFCSSIVVVATTEDVQRQRLMARNQLSEQDAMNRIKAQMPVAEKVKRADYVIDNNGSKDELPVKVEKVLAAVKPAAPLSNSTLAILSIGAAILLWWL